MLYQESEIKLTRKTCIWPMSYSIVKLESCKSMHDDDDDDEDDDDDDDDDDDTCIYDDDDDDDESRDE